MENNNTTLEYENKALRDRVASLEKLVQELKEDIRDSNPNNNNAMAVDNMANPMENNLTKVIVLDVGGHVYHTTVDTLTRETSMLYAMFSGRHNIVPQRDGSIFIDRDGTHFAYILNYLRDGPEAVMPHDPETRERVLTEAKYYTLTGLINQLDPTLDLISKFGPYMWNPNAKADSVIIVKDSNTIKKNCEGHAIATLAGIIKGKPYVRVKLAENRVRGCYYFGVIRKAVLTNYNACLRDLKDSYVYEDNGCVWADTKQNKTRNTGKDIDKAIPRCTMGNEVGIRVNMDAFTVTWDFNGNEFYTTKLRPADDYIFCFSLYNKMGRMQLVSRPT